MRFMFIRQKALVVLMAAVLAICGIFAGSRTVFAENGNVYPEHEPYGTGVGAQPGRVVWFHDKDSVDWDGTRELRIRMCQSTGLIPLAALSTICPPA